MNSSDVTAAGGAYRHGRPFADPAAYVRPGRSSVTQPASEAPAIEPAKGKSAGAPAHIARQVIADGLAEEGVPFGRVVSRIAQGFDFYVSSPGEETTPAEETVPATESGESAGTNVPVVDAGSEINPTVGEDPVLALLMALAEDDSSTETGV